MYARRNNSAENDIVAVRRREINFSPIDYIARGGGVPTPLYCYYYYTLSPVQAFTARFESSLRTCTFYVYDRGLTKK